MNLLSDGEPLTVADLIRALQKLPPDAKLGHYDVHHKDRITLTADTYNHWNSQFFIQREGSETWLCNSYDCELEPGDALDFGTERP